MDRRMVLQGMGAGAILVAMGGVKAMSETTANTVFELRTYHASDGKLDALLARFRDHTMTLFKKHKLEVVGFWTPTDDPLKGKTLVYILKHPSREAATANWAAFHDDPEWKSVSAASEVNGKLTTSVDSVYMKLTDFSPKV
jgi:NIPSNAP